MKINANDTKTMVIRRKVKKIHIMHNVSAEVVCNLKMGHIPVIYPHIPIKVHRKGSLAKCELMNFGYNNSLLTIMDITICVRIQDLFSRFTVDQIKVCWFSTPESQAKAMANPKRNLLWTMFKAGYFVQHGDMTSKKQLTHRHGCQPILRLLHQLFVYSSYDNSGTETKRTTCKKSKGKGQLSVDMLNKLRDFSRKLTLFVSQFREEVCSLESASVAYVTCVCTCHCENADRTGISSGLRKDGYHWERDPGCGVDVETLPAEFLQKIRCDRA
ncbi:hypothetical protein ANN_04240 [Periplaneta americana]|uniref:Uncharacterized protein n=1 Tax=Periplaneta americana TaxID=6978 RepID=A0ABQ8T9I6_PERAM|nr:hypothetical protein ANN_04240 [Periplaneta americana]